jgi:hypothetical protein
MIATSLRAVAAAALLGAAGAPVLAQQPAPAPAQQQQFTPAHLAAAREMSVEVGIEDPIAVILDELRGQILGTFTTTRPELRVDLEGVLNGLVPQIAVKRQEILDVGVRAFAARFSEKEIAEILAFLRTPTGQKYRKEQPAAFNDFFRELQPWIARTNDFVLENVRAEMKKRGHNL